LYTVNKQERYVDVKQQALEALTEALNLFDNYPELYECMGTYQVMVAAIKSLTKEVTA
jgi:hypothetical protein